jgi:glycosyltransferase involved in cell wall biosynthesis
VSGPLVSICTPTYHRPELLRRAIASCRAQTYANFEIVITDNSENEASRDLVASLQEPRIRYFKNETNIGNLANIRKVGSLARGKYMIVLMDDDLLQPEALALMVAAFEKHPTVGVVMAPMALIDADDRRIYPYFYLIRKMYYRYRYQVGDGLVERRRVLKEFLVRDYPCCVPSGIMYRTEAFQRAGGFDLAGDFALDLDLAMRLAVHHDFYYVDRVLSAFRYTPISLTSTMHTRGSDVGVFYRITRRILADPSALALYPAPEHARLIRDSIYFCTCRALLNGLAGLRARNFSIIMETVRLIFREDPYLWNKLRLPCFVLREILISFRPPARPLPPETEFRGG